MKPPLFSLDVENDWHYLLFCLLLVHVFVLFFLAATDHDLQQFKLIFPYTLATIIPTPHGPARRVHVTTVTVPIPVSKTVDFLTSKDSGHFEVTSCQDVHHHYQLYD